MNRTHVDDLIPAYALGALEPDERLSVEAHLDECAYCARLARGHMEAAAALAMAVPPMTPSPALRARIMSSLDARAERAPTLDARRSHFRIRVRWPAAAVAVAASFGLIVLGSLVAMVIDLRGDLRDMGSRLNEQRAFTYTVALPGTETMMLESADQASKARGMLMASKDHTWALLVSERMAPVHESMGYQVWLVKGGERTSGGVFTVDEGGYGQLFIKFPVPMDELTRIGVTLEPRGGSAAPTSPAVLFLNMQ